MARPTVPPELLYEPNPSATIEVINEAASHGLGKCFRRQMPNGINQPKTYQKLRSVKQRTSATK